MAKQHSQSKKRRKSKKSEQVIPRSVQICIMCSFLMTMPESGVTELCKYPKLCPHKDHALGQNIRDKREKKLAQSKKSLEKSDASNKNAKLIPSSSNQSSTIASNATSSAVLVIEIYRMFASFCAQYSTELHQGPNTIDGIRYAFLIYYTVGGDVARYLAMFWKIRDLDYHSLQRPFPETSSIELEDEINEMFKKFKDVFAKLIPRPDTIDRIRIAFLIYNAVGGDISKYNEMFWKLYDELDLRPLLQQSNSNESKYKNVPEENMDCDDTSDDNESSSQSESEDDTVDGKMSAHEESSMQNVPVENMNGDETSADDPPNVSNQIAYSYTVNTDGTLTMTSLTSIRAHNEEIQLPDTAGSQLNADDVNSAPFMHTIEQDSDLQTAANPLMTSTQENLLLTFNEDYGSNQVDYQPYQRAEVYDNLIDVSPLSSGVYDNFSSFDDIFNDLQLATNDLTESNTTYLE